MKRRALEHLISSTNLTCTTGRRARIPATTPLLLASRDDTFFVLSGHVDLFAVRVEEGEVVGQRHPLFRATAGEIVFGPDAHAPFKFLAVGIDETEVVSKFRDEDFTRFEPSHLGALLDRFIGGLSAWYAQDAPDGSTIVVDAGSEMETFRHTPIFAPSRRAVWIRSKSGIEPLALFGKPDLSAPILPVTSTLWVAAEDTAILSGTSSSDLVALGSWRQAVDAYIGILGRFLDEAIRLTDANAVNRRAARLSADRSALDAALRDLSAVVSQEESATAALDAGDALHTAFLAVARALKIENTDAPRRVVRQKNLPLIDSLAWIYRVRIRRVMLRDDWWRHDAGPLIAFTEKGDPVALLTLAGHRYEQFDPATGVRNLVTPELAGRLQSEAIMLYQPLPASCRNLRDLVRAILPEIRADLRMVGGMGVLGGLVAAFTPVMISVMIENVLPSADVEQHIHITLGLLCAAIGAASFEVVKAIALLRAEGRADLRLQAAIFDRLLRLPAGFFRRYTAGDLADRVLGIQTIRQIVSGTTIQGLLGAIFATFSLALLLFYNWKLSFVAFGLVLISILVTVYWGRQQLGEERRRVAQQGEAEGFVVQTLTGLAKLKISAAEGRAYAKWARIFARQKHRFVSAQRFANLQDIFHATFPMLATAVVFAMASFLLKGEVTDLELKALVTTDQASKSVLMSTGDFVAFNTAFGQFLAAMTALAMALTRSLLAVPVFQRLKPIIEEEPEVTETDKSAQRLRGGIEFSHVVFRYNRDGPLILDDFSLTIEPNEFVAIVGPSGSGKSTLIRLLLGFERCEAGEIYFDQTPASALDMTSVRQQVRVVLQQGQLMTGSIFSNIVGVSTTLTQEDAWQAAKLVELDEDIEAMPMGMHTQIMEGVNTISGGQRQRLMIARALVQRPRILLLDEPTSALDNRTQDTVMSSLARLTATRIVIAHRLSTVRAADRVVVMDNGKILQSGSFDELMSVDGPFKEMALRQLL